MPRTARPDEEVVTTTDSEAVTEATPPALAAVGGFRLWFGVLGGLTAWMVRLLASASLVGWACRSGAVGEVVLYLISAAMAVVTLAALAVCVCIRRRAGTFGDDVTWSTAGFLAAVGLLMNAISLALIGFEASFIPFVDTCASV